MRQIQDREAGSVQILYMLTEFNRWLKGKPLAVPVLEVERSDILIIQLEKTEAKYPAPWSTVVNQQPIFQETVDDLNFVWAGEVRSRSRL